MDKKVILKTNREDPLLRRHPWLFSGAVEDVVGNPGPGDTVEIFSSKDEWLARGAYSPHSQIRVRVWTWDPDEQVDAELIFDRIRHSIERRKTIVSTGEFEAYREVHAESDLLPGLIVDRYANFRVVQILSAGAEQWRGVLQEALTYDRGCIGLYERSDVEVRELEGLQLRTGPLWGSKPPEELCIREGDLSYGVNLHAGHKTGFYLDQRDNRSGIRKWIQGGAVLDAFCYTGGFALNAQRAGAKHVLAIDSSADALLQADRNASINSIRSGSIEWRVADVFYELRALRDRKSSFDVIILDPPRFAPTSAHISRASRGYKDINLLGFKLLKPGGRLITFSCSGGISPELFQKIVADAALDAGVDAQIRAWMAQPSDHPVATAFPEGRYLKGLVCTV
ncbi:MAG: class I SAM-dependent methyltransferase [Anaerolineales bacterium]